MEAKISIIIPAYNVAGYLETCLDSILAQSFQEFEVILVDDGSTDGTSRICDEYEARDHRITVIHKNNEGVSIARNTGIAVARGKYFLFFDGDDFVEPYTCEELYRLIEEKKVDMIIYGYHRYRDGKIFETSYPIFSEGYYQGEKIIEELLPRFIGISDQGVNKWFRHEEHALYVENPALWRAMVSADIIRKNSLSFNKNLKVGEDTIFISEYLSYATSCYVHHQCYYYLVTRESSTIYVYEQNPLAKLEGKLKLLTARRELTDNIRTRKTVSIDSTWCGTVLMSAIEIAFLLSKKNPMYRFHKRYQMFLTYVKEKEVQQAIQNFHIDVVPNVMVVPFVLLKWKWYVVLFICTTILQMIHFEFQRS